MTSLPSHKPNMQNSRVWRDCQKYNTRQWTKHTRCVLKGGTAHRIEDSSFDYELIVVLDSLLGTRLEQIFSFFWHIVYLVENFRRQQLLRRLQAVYGGPPNTIRNVLYYQLILIPTVRDRFVRDFMFKCN